MRVAGVDPSKKLKRITITVLITAISVLSLCVLCNGYGEPVYDPVYDPAPGYYETSVFAIGTCAVGLVFVQPPQGNWTTAKEEDALLIVQEALDKFEDLSSGCIDFLKPEVFRAATTYDPSKTLTDEMWISEVMSNIGFEGASYREKVYNCTNYLRQRLGSDWAIIVLMVDTPYFGNTGGNSTAYAWLGGPCVSYAYHHDGSRLMLVHEIAHGFYATDEYNGKTEYSGYLYVPDNESARCLMNSAAFTDFCAATREQLGWRDSDQNGIQDIVDNPIYTKIDQYPQNPTVNTVLRFTGTSVVGTYETSNPNLRDMTIIKVANVEFRVDGGPWLNATPADGNYDGAVEDFFFVTPSLEPGQHTIEARSHNTVGNTDALYAIDTISIVEGGDVGYPIVNFTYRAETENIAVRQPVLFDASGSYNVNASISIYTWSFGDDNSTSTVEPYVSHFYSSPGKFNVVLNVTNSRGLWNTTMTSITVLPRTDLNKDGVVNILDLGIIANAFGSLPQNPRWNPAADVNNDGKVNIIDLTLAAVDFGKSFR